MAEAQRQTADTPWYQDGLRFSCTQCGNCCTGGPGAVWHTDAEAAEMATALGITTDEFLQRYSRVLGGRRSLNEHETEHGFDCIFLDRTTQPGKALCRVYLARPTQCRTWPFWSDNIRSARAWRAAKERTPCPGMDSGTLIPVEKIRILRGQDDADNAAAPW